jgi:hypothetical protein
MEASGEAEVQPARGAVLGLFLGMNGWVLGLALAALLAGEPQLVLSHALPGALVSSALAWGLLRAWNAVLRRRPAQARRVLLGGLCLALGILLLYLRVFIEPVLVPGGPLDAVLSATASTRRVPLALAWAALAAGVLVLVSVGRRRA